MVIALVDDSYSPVVTVYFVEQSVHYMRTKILRSPVTYIYNCVPKQIQSVVELISRAGLFKRQCVAMNI